MQKRVKGKKLSRSRTARDALYRSLTRELVRHGKITTTTAKAKGVQIYIEKLTSIARKGGLSDRRRVLAKLANDKVTTDILFKLASGFKRESGFTRIIALPKRRGDAADISRLEWTDLAGIEEKSKKDSKKKSSKKEKEKEKKSDEKTKKDKK